MASGGVGIAPAAAVAEVAAAGSEGGITTVPASQMRFAGCPD